MLFVGNGNEKAYGQTSKDRIPTLIVNWDAASPVSGERLKVFAASGIRVFVEPSKTDETRVLVPYFKLGDLRFGQVFPGLGGQRDPLVLSGRKEVIIQMPLHKNATFNVFDATLESSQPVSSASLYLQGAQAVVSAYHMDVTARNSNLVAEMNGGKLKVDAEGGAAKVSGNCNDLDAKLRAFNLSMQGVCSSGVVDLDEESLFLRKDSSGKIKYIETLLKPPTVV